MYISQLHGFSKTESSCTVASNYKQRSFTYYFRVLAKTVRKVSIIPRVKSQETLGESELSKLHIPISLIHNSISHQSIVTDFISGSPGNMTSMVFANNHHDHNHIGSTQFFTKRTINADIN